MSKKEILLIAFVLIITFASLFAFYKALDSPILSSVRLKCIEDCEDGIGYSSSVIESINTSVSCSRYCDSQIGEG